jgi:hypothetical protein
MKFAAPVIVSLMVSGCSAQSSIEPPCGRPGNLWIPAETIGSPHHQVEHLIEVTHAGQILLNRELTNTLDLAAFLATEEKKRPVLPYLYFDFDAHADCAVVKETRALVEKSGICKEGYCITGDDSERPPMISN